MDRKLAKRNFDYCQQTIDLKNNIEYSYLELAQRLHKIFNEKLYEPNYETFSDFTEEIDISQATASKLIGIWQTFIIDYQLPPKQIAESGGWSKVSEIAKYANSKASALKWLARAAENTRTDLRKFITEEKTGIDMADCKHKDRTIITYWKCNTCGDTERIYEDDK